MKKDIDQARCENNIKLYYFRSFFGSLGFTRAVFILYLLEKDFNNTEVGSFQTIFFVSSVLLEIPTGYVSDRFGRKWSVLLGYGASTLWGLGMIWCEEYFAFAGLFFLLGVSKALVSGADHALVYDSLTYIDKKELYGNVFARTEALASIALGAAILAGGFLQRLSWNSVFLAYVSAMTIATATILFTVEAPIKSTKGKMRTARVIDIVQFFQKPSGRRLLLLMASYAIFEAIMSAYFIYGQTLFNSLGLEAYQVGCIFFFSQICSAIAFASSNRVMRWISFPWLGLLIMGGTIPLLAFHEFSGSTGAIILFLILNFPPEILYTAVHVKIQDNIPKELRASLLSVFTALTSAVIGLSFFIMGILFDYFPIHRVVSCSSTILLVALVLFAFYNLHRDHAEDYSNTV
jgi:MFS family permease